MEHVPSLDALVLAQSTHRLLYTRRGQRSNGLCAGCIGLAPPTNRHKSASALMFADCCKGPTLVRHAVLDWSWSHQVALGQQRRCMPQLHAADNINNLCASKWCPSLISRSSPLYQQVVSWVYEVMVIQRSCTASAGNQQHLVHPRISKEQPARPPEATGS